MAFIPPALAAISALSAAAGTAGTLSAIATGVSVVGTAASSLSAANAANFQAKLEGQRAQIAQDQASIKASEIARGAKQDVAAARAGAIQNGFAISGSTADLIDQVERQGHLDYLTAVYDGTLQAQGLRTDAELSKRRATSAIVGGVLGAGAQALGGVSNFYKMKGASINVSGTT